MQWLHHTDYDQCALCFGLVLGYLPQKTSRLKKTKWCAGRDKKRGLFVASASTLLRSQQTKAAARVGEVRQKSMTRKL